MRVPPPKIAYGYLQATKQLSYENKRTEHWSRKHGFLKLTSGKHYMVKLWPLGLGEGHKFRTYLILKVYSSICNIFFFIYSVLDRLVRCLIPWRLSKVIYSICCRLLGVARTQFSVLSAKDNPEAPSTLYRRNLKTAFSLWKLIKCFPSTIRWRNLKTQQSPVILYLFSRKIRAGKSWPSRFRKAPFSNCFPSTLECKAGVLKFLRFEERFWKVPGVFLTD